MKLSIKNIIAFLSVCLLLVSVWYFKHIVWHIIISVVLSLIGNPLVTYLSNLRLKKFKIPRTVAAALTLLIIWSVLTGMISLLGPLVVQEAKTFSNIDIVKLTDYFSEELSQIKEQVEIVKQHSETNYSFEEYIQAKLKSFIDISFLTNILNSFTGALGDIFVAIFSISFMTFFFLKDEHLWRRIVLAMTPDKQVEKVKHILKSIKQLLFRYFIGLFLEVIIVMTLNTIWLSIIGLGLEQAIVIGFLTGLLNVIPYIGPLIGTVLGTLLGIAITIEAGMYDMIFSRMFYLGFAFVGTQIIDNLLLQPIIYSNSVKAHPLEIFIVIMVAGSLAGITGMILAIPAYTLLRVIAREFLSSFKVIRELTKGMDNTDTT